MSRHTPVERLPSGLFFTTNFTKVQRAVEPEEVHSQVGPPEQIVYSGGQPKKRSIFPYYDNVAPRALSTTALHDELPPSSRASSVGELDASPASLPLLNVSVDVNVEGFIAHTTLVQRFENHSNDTITQARYTFPLYDGAVVTSFSCTIGNKRVLQGKVEPKKEARRKYKESIEKKEVAALLEEHTPEIFETAVGNIPPETAIQVQITYMNELKAATGPLLTEGLSVILPTSIAPRYPAGPKKYKDVSTVKHESLDITITVLDDDELVENIVSESGHKILSEHKNVARPPQVITDLDDLDDLGDDDPQAHLDLKIVQATYKSTTPVLKGDFIAIIQMRDSSPLRSRAALSLTDKNGHAALMINIKPSEVLSSVAQTKKFDGEIVFVVDQSGSMDGAKIRTLRSALPLSLTSLPVNCAVNLISFGSHTRFWWPTSQRYSAEVLKTAKKHASSIEADMGGTELLFALQEVVKSRLKDRSSMQIILITDGEVEPETTIRFVWQTRQELGDRIRFFALGIGDQVSHQLIECIGEFGGGFGETVDIRNVPKWEKKLIRMLKGTMMPNSWSCDIDLGPRFERQDPTTYDLSEHSPQAQGRIPYIQAPFPTPSLHPFRYQTLNFLVDLKAVAKNSRKQKLLGEVTLRPHGEAGEAVQLALRVDIKNKDTEAIHQMTAKAILRDLEAGLDRPQVTATQRDLAQGNGEYLGTRYSISSKWTSFVAVDQVTQEVDEIDLYKASIKSVDRSQDLVFLNHNEDHDDDEHDYELGSYAPMITSGCSTSFSMRDYCSGGGDRGWLKDRPLNASPLARPATSLLHPQYNAAPSSIVAPSSEYDDFDGPIGLQEAVATQGVTGIFEIDAPIRERLELHYCPRTAETLLDTVKSATPSKTLEARTNIRELGYTMMFVHYIQTHLPQDQGLWDLMVQKATDAVQQALMLRDDSLLVSLHQLLEKASMHAHCSSTGDWSDIVKSVPFPPTSTGEVCPACDTARDKVSTGSFECPFPGCNGSASGWSSWDELWKHQVLNGHLMCHQKRGRLPARKEEPLGKRKLEEQRLRALSKPTEVKEEKQTAKTAKTKRSLWDKVLRRRK